MDGFGVAVLLLVILSFLLFIIRVALIFYHNMLLSRELKRLAREAEAARQTSNPVVTGTDNQTNQPPKDDLPPAYDDVVQAKLALQAAEEGRIGESRTNTQSTITLTTFVDANGSNGNLNESSRAAATSCANLDETLPPAYENAVFEHDSHENDFNHNSNLNRPT